MSEFFKSPEVAKKSLDNLVEEISEIQNKKHGEILNLDSSIKMEGFESVSGFDVEKDKSRVLKQEEIFSDAHTTNSSRLDFFKDKGLDTPEKRLSYWREKEGTEPEKLEKAILCVFYKFLNSEFIVARASKYDDYFNGVDTVIIDAKTQKVVGAFDEIRGTDSLIGNTKKLEKVFNKAREGGAHLKYGLNFENELDENERQKIVRKEMYHVPLFMIALSQQDLENLLTGMNTEVEGQPSEIETKIFNKILDSFENQIKIFEDPRSGIKGYVQQNINSFKGAISRMRKMGEEKSSGHSSLERVV